MTKRRGPPKNVEPLEDLTGPKYPPAPSFSIKAPKNSGGWKNPKMNGGFPGAPGRYRRARAYL